MKRVAVITGGSSGIGYCTAMALKGAGCSVWELSRREADNEGINHISADITDPERVKKAVGEIMKKEGQIDILINNAGFGISGAAEFTENADAKRLLEVNLFGMVNMVREIVPIMRAQGGGRIVNLSSVAGVAPIPFQAWYSVTKASVNAYTMALANEVRPFGIEVCAVMPGDIKTGFTAAREKDERGDDIYGGRISRSVAGMEKDEINGIDPMVAGRSVCHAAMRKGCKVISSIGPVYKLLSVLVKLLPVGLVNRILYIMYAR